MADPEGRLSAERLAEIERVIQSDRGSTAHAPSLRANCPYCIALGLLTELADAAAAIDTLEAERDQLRLIERSTWEQKNALAGEVQRLNAAAAADAPKLQAAADVAAGWTNVDRIERCAPRGLELVDRIEVRTTVGWSEALDRLAALFPPTQPAESTDV
jgi:hypothetical protein